MNKAFKRYPKHRYYETHYLICILENYKPHPATITGRISFSESAAATHLKNANNDLNILGSSFSGVIRDNIK